MAIKQICYLGEPILRQKSAPVDDVAHPNLRNLAMEMINVMHGAQGVGLAAPQCGIGKRVIVFWVPEDRDHVALPVQVLVNPVITPLETGLVMGWEGCLSLPGLRGQVPRYQRIGYKGYDLMGKWIEREATGFHARVVQHEVDHLDGIMYLDRMTGWQGLTHESVWLKKDPIDGIAQNSQIIPQT